MSGHEGAPGRESQPRSWIPAHGLSGAMVVGVLFQGAGLVLARVDLAILGLPFLLVAAAALGAWPGRIPDKPVSVDLTPATDGAELAFVLSVPSSLGVEGVSLRVGVFGDRGDEFLLTEGSAQSLRGLLPVLHSGPQELFRIDHRLLGRDALLLASQAEVVRVSRVIPPAHVTLASLPLPRRLLGLTGTHDSSRPGEGGNFHDIHPFVPGDRLRRIDWKTTARRGRFTGDLYVRRASATSEATVVIVMDSRDDVGEQVAEWQRNRPAQKGIGSLDLAREAAASLAAAYVRAGDRVGFNDLAGSARMVAPGGGGRQLRRLQQAIALTQQPSGGPTHRRRLPILPAGAIVYVLSTFLDDEIGRMAALWRRAGHRVIAVEALPAARFDRTTRTERIAHRILLMERGDRIRSLAAQGVEFLTWQESDSASSRATGLRMLSRPARGPR